MSFPEVTVNQINLAQGENKEVERALLFIGVSTDGTPASNINKVIPINSQTDLDVLMGDGQLKNDLKAALANGGQNWFGYIYILPPESTMLDTIAAISMAQPYVQIEGVVCTVTVNSKSDIELFNTLRSTITAKFGTWQHFILPVEGCLDGETWADMVSRLTALQSGIAAPAVQLVPRLFGNEVGVYAGRLCTRAVTIADSPMRVETGPVLDLGSADKPKDANGVELGLDTLIALEKARYSVPAWFIGFDGVYWSDGRTLDAEGGDFQAIENLRVIDKMARRIRIKAIRKVANRSLNSSPSSIEFHKHYFAGVMRDMSKAIKINDIQFPGELKPPKDGDVSITWLTKTKVAIYAVGRTHECPKGILVGIMLDLTLEEE